MGVEIMVRNSILCILLLTSLAYLRVSDSQGQVLDTYSISSVAYPKTRLGSYDWRYIRVDLPSWFSSMSISLESDVDIDLNRFRKTPAGSLAIVCFREGSLPLPDVYNTSVMGLVMEYVSNSSFVGDQSLQIVEKCYPMQKSIWLRVTNEQISPGTWYLGIFNGIGPVRTQSKMIDRGTPYSFSANISVEGCMNSMMLGKFCNQTVNILACDANSYLTGIGVNSKLYKTLRTNIIACRNANGIVCHGNGGPKIYVVDVVGVAEELLIAVANVTFNQAQPSNGTGSYSLMCYARHDAMPLETVYDFSGEISKVPLFIRLPKAGRWYITVQPIDIGSITNKSNGGSSLKVCYSLEWQLLQCPLGKAGINCTQERYTLQAVIQKGSSVAFQSNYLPISAKVSSSPSASFHLEPLLSNFSTGESSNGSWTFFILDIPFGSAMGNIHFHLTSDILNNYEIYVRYGGLPSLTSWDYFIANSTNSSDGSMFFKIYDLTENTISFYLLYAKAGTWCFGVRQLNRADSSSHSDISLTVESCPSQCSSVGLCRSSSDASGHILYSYCHCDLNHGGFDCGVELVSHKSHILHSTFLVASNAAALFPAYWALRNKAIAEWILFTSSGIASAVYHACDSGTVCLLSFHVLQFFDFWLSFMAVVTTFIYLTTMSDGSKRTLDTIIALLTALMALTNPTRSKNISIVLGLGALGLLIGWLVEFWTHNRLFFSSEGYQFDLIHRWHTARGWVHNIIKTVSRSYRWGFIVAGAVALLMASMSWILETSQTYWIWHSSWHAFIYTSSFLFMCSKLDVSSFESGETSDVVAYELTRQTSFHENERGSEGPFSSRRSF